MSYYGPDVTRIVYEEMQRQAQWRTYGTGPPPSREFAEVLMLASLGAPAAAKPRLAARRRQLDELTKRLETNT